MADKTLQENKMGVMPIPKLLITMSLPMMASQLVQALYNIVDSIFVSRVSEAALTAVTLAFPIQMLIIALAGGIGVGTNALVSRALGEGNQEKVAAVARTGVIMVSCAYLVSLIVGIFFTRPLIEMQAAAGTSPDTIDMAVDYLRIACIMSFGVYFEIIFERLIQSTGKTFYTMITQTVGAVFNIIFDPIMIFGYFGFPAMGVAGAALATVLGQILAAGLAVFFHIKKNTEIRFSLRGRIQGRIVKEIVIIGGPSTIMQAIGSVMTLAMNKILTSFSETATAVFGAYFKIQSFVFMPIFGLNMGMVPIVSYNYGAQKRSRIIKTIKLSVIIAEAITLVGFLVFQILPSFLLTSFFDASEHMLEIGDPALRTMSIGFLVAGGCIIFGSVFQALGNGMYSAIVSVARQLVVLIPVAYLMSLTGNVRMVWWAFPIAEAMSLAVSIFFMFRINRKIISQVADNP